MLLNTEHSCDGLHTESEHKIAGGRYLLFTRTDKLNVLDKREMKKEEQGL